MSVITSLRFRLYGFRDLSHGYGIQVCNLQCFEDPTMFNIGT